MIKDNGIIERNKQLVDGLFDIIDFEYSFVEQITQAYRSLSDKLNCRDMIINNLLQANSELFERKIDSFMKQVSKGFQWVKNKEIVIHKEMELCYKAKTQQQRHLNRNTYQNKVNSKQLPNKDYITNNDIITKLKMKQANNMENNHSQIQYQHDLQDVKPNNLHAKKTKTQRHRPISLSLNNSYCETKTIPKNRLMDINLPHKRNYSIASAGNMSISLETKGKHNNTMSDGNNQPVHYGALDPRRYETLHIEVKLLEKFRTILNRYNQQPTEAENRRKNHLMNKKYLQQSYHKKKKMT